MTIDDLKILRHDYLRNIFPSSAITLSLVLISLVYCSLKNSFGSIFMIFSSMSLGIGILAFFLLTRKHRLDFNSGKIIIEKAEIANKESKIDYEAGSATTPVNLLSIFFIKEISKREMKESIFYNFIVNGEKIPVSKTMYDQAKIGDYILIRRMENTKLLLGIEIE